MPQRESQLEAAVRRYAIQKGCLFYKFVSPSKSGVPDRIIISPKGKIGFLELKQKGKKPKPLQQYELENLQARGVPATYADTLQGACIFINGLCGPDVRHKANLFCDPRRDIEAIRRKHGILL